MKLSVGSKVKMIRDECYTRYMSMFKEFTYSSKKCRYGMAPLEGEKGTIVDRAWSQRLGITLYLVKGKYNYLYIYSEKGLQPVQMSPNEFYKWIGVE